MIKNLSCLSKPLIVLLACIGVIPVQAAEGGLDAGMVNPGYHEQPSWFKTSFLDLRDDIAEAKASGKRVMLFFYQDGCPYCGKLLRDNFSQRVIAEKSQQYFDVIAINMWGDREVTDLKGATSTEKHFAEQMRVMFTPTLLFLDEQGGVALRVNGYYAPHKFLAALDYVGQHKETQGSFADYYQLLAATPAYGKLHDGPFLIKTSQLNSLMDKDNKPLMVLFEQRECPACDELHNDVFTRKETQEQLARLNVVLLDMWSNDAVTTPEGKSTTVRAWAHQLNINYAPTMVFFDNTGKEVFRAEAYLKSFHLQSVMDYVASGAYREQPNFQRYIEGRADRLRAQGVQINLME